MISGFLTRRILIYGFGHTKLFQKIRTRWRHILMIFFIDLDILDMQHFEISGPHKTHNDEHGCLVLGGSKTIFNRDPFEKTEHAIMKYLKPK